MSLDHRGETAPSDADRAALCSQLLAAAEATQRIEALLVRAQAALLSYFETGDAVIHCRHQTPGDVALALAGMSASTVIERLRLHGVLTRHHLLDAAFLEGRITLCQVLAAEPVFRRIDRDDEVTLLHWIEIASSLSVRVLKREVRRILDTWGIEITAEEEDEGQMVSYEAPLPFQIAWDQMMDLACKAVGHEAPVHVCLGAILVEAGQAGLAEPMPADSVEPRAIPIRPRRVVASPAAVEHAEQTLRQASTFLEEVKAGVTVSIPRTPQHAADALGSTELLRARASILFAHLIRDLRDTGARSLLGYRSMADLAEDRFGFSERTARNRVAESDFFEHAEGLEAAYARGEISLMQAHVVRKMAAGLPHEPFIERASQVTFRQIRREQRVFELMRKCGLADPTTRPFPNPDIEASLIAALGGEAEAIEGRLRARGVPVLPDEGSPDPAENAILMDRIEAMVEMLALRARDEPANAAASPDRQTFTAPGRNQTAEPTDHPPEADRQTFAEPGRNQTAEPADHPPEADRQTFAEQEEQMKPLEQVGQVTIRFWVRSDIAADLLLYLDETRRRHGAAYPIWAAFAALFAPVREEWLRRNLQRRTAR